MRYHFFPSGFARAFVRLGAGFVEQVDGLLVRYRALARASSLLSLLFDDLDFPSTSYSVSHGPKLKLRLALKAAFDGTSSLEALSIRQSEGVWSGVPKGRPCGLNRIRGGRR